MSQWFSVHCSFRVLFSVSSTHISYLTHTLVTLASGGCDASDLHIYLYFREHTYPHTDTYSHTTQTKVNFKRII